MVVVVVVVVVACGVVVWVWGPVVWGGVVWGGVVRGLRVRDGRVEVSGVRCRVVRVGCLVVGFFVTVERGALIVSDVCRATSGEPTVMLRQFRNRTRGTPGVIPAATLPRPPGPRVVESIGVRCPDGIRSQRTGDGLIPLLRRLITT